MISVHLLRQILSEYPDFNWQQRDAAHLANFVVHKLVVSEEKQTTPVRLLNALALIENELEQQPHDCELVCWNDGETFHAAIFTGDPEHEAVNVENVTPLADALSNLSSQLEAH